MRVTRVVSTGQEAVLSLNLGSENISCPTRLLVGPRVSPRAVREQSIAPIFFPPNVDVLPIGILPRPTANASRSGIFFSFVG